MAKLTFKDYKMAFGSHAFLGLILHMNSTAICPFVFEIPCVQLELLGGAGVEDMGHQNQLGSSSVKNEVAQRILWQFSQ